MRVLVDTNIVLRFANVDDGDHDRVAETVSKLLDDGSELGITPQVMREFWNVATRPRSSNGLSLPTSTVNEWLQGLLIAFDFWDDTPGIAEQWRMLCTQLQVQGVQVHDANHAAAALRHGASHVLTLNTADFLRFEKYGLETISPLDVL